MASRRQRNPKRPRPSDDDDEPTTDIPSADMVASDVEGEDLHNDDLVRNDYKPMPELDRYEDTGLDRRQYGMMDPSARREAEAAMAERERARKRGRITRGAGGLAEPEDDEITADAEDLRARMRSRREDAAMGFEGGDEGENILAALKDGTSIREHVMSNAGQRYIYSAFTQLLSTTTDEHGASVYAQRINNMCAANKQSLEVSWNHFQQRFNQLGVLLADAPKHVIKVLDDAAKAMVLSMYSDYESIHDEIYVRLTDLPLHDSLRNLRQFHLNQLVQVTGVVTRRSVVFPQLKIVRFTCQSCNHLTPQMYTHEGSEIKLGTCPECQQNGPFTLSTEHSVYRNYQTITLQETPGSVPAGRVPRYKEVILLADLIDKARPGDEVEVVGAYVNRFDISLNSRQGFPVFSTVIEANNVTKVEVATAARDLTEEDKRELLALSKDPRIVDRLVKSIAPSVYGQEHMKTAIAMSMFGGVRKVNPRHRIRGDINVLLLGDPGTAKSQCLKYVEKTAPRAVFTTGKGASAVGLTAAVHKDPMTGEYTLEGGALVLADQGTCLIDEFDKMNDQDRTSIHEAMEQQSISISKAGIVTSLQARCSVIAAANPIGGRYDPQKSFSDNVALTDPILQRFDVLCVLQDTVDPVNDERLAQFVIKSHGRSHPKKHLAAMLARANGEKVEEEADVDPDIIPQDIIKKYIMYARRRQPQFNNFHTKKISELYADLRQSAEKHNGIPIAVRHIESIMRMAEAHARMRLSDQVTDADANAAIRVMLESFVQSQKYSAKRALRKEFSKYITASTQHHDLLLHLLQSLVAENVAIRQMQARGIESSADEAEMDAFGADVEITEQALRARAAEYGVRDAKTLTTFTRSAMFKKAGFVTKRDARGAVVISRSFEPLTQ